MKISVALCTFNGEKFLQDQLESIVRQSRLPDELVVCDDCSTDNTLGILLAFQSKAPFPVHIVKNETNLKVTKNFEKAIGLCRGDIIVLADQDDVWSHLKLARTEAVLTENPEAGYIFSDAELVDEKLDPLGFGLWESVNFTGPLKDNFIMSHQLECLLEQSIVTGATMAFRAIHKNLAVPFPENPFWIHDGWLSVCLSASGAYGVPISEKLIYYRQHSNQQFGVTPPGDRKLNPENLNFWEEIKSVISTRGSFMEGADIMLGKACLLKAHLETKNIVKSKVKSSVEYLNQVTIHFANRKSIRSSNFMKRFFLGFKEVSSGRYGRFSLSWKSFLSDLIL
jgi:glycosyltransferase involved in cell wall biosynthesis